MTRLPQTRHSLILRLKDRSDDAWEEFVEIYEQALYRFCCSRGLQEADARDVTQDVLSAVERRIDTWKNDPSKGSFRGWLFRVARNVAVDKLIELSKKISASGDTRVIQALAEHPDSTEQQQSAFWFEYRRALFNWAAEKVKPEVNTKTWQAFWLTAIEGRKPDQVAKEVDMSIGGVYTSKCRVVARIKAMISKLDVDQFTGEDLIEEIRVQSI